MLTDCIDLCRRNVSCKAANFETGLCVLFGASAEELPGEFTTHSFAFHLPTQGFISINAMIQKVVIQ